MGLGADMCVLFIERDKKFEAFLEVVVEQLNEDELRFFV